MNHRNYIIQRYTVQQDLSENVKSIRVNFVISMKILCLVLFFCCCGFCMGFVVCSSGFFLFGFFWEAVCFVGGLFVVFFCGKSTISICFLTICRI